MRAKKINKYKVIMLVLFGFLTSIYTFYIDKK